MSWTDRDLTTLAAAATGTPQYYLRGPLIAFWTSDGNRHVTYVGTDTNLHQFLVDPLVRDTDLTNVGGVSLPVPALTGYVAPDGSQYIYYIDRARTLYELTAAPGSAWTETNLTTVTGAAPPNPVSRLSGWWSHDGTRRVVYVDQSGHVRLLWLRPGHTWSESDLIALTGAPRAQYDASLAGYSKVDGSQHVAYLGVGGHIHELRAGHSWEAADLTVQAHAAIGRHRRRSEERFRLPLARGRASLTGRWHGAEPSEPRTPIVIRSSIVCAPRRPRVAWRSTSSSIGSRRR